MHLCPVKVEPKEINFSSSISFNGSEQLLFTPVGRETTVTLSSAWPDPGFTGGNYRITAFPIQASLPGKI
jgi:inner membrane protein involved in colicin E2 resistance